MSPTTDRAILVDAPVETVFEYVADWRHTTKYQRHFSRFQAVGEPTYGLGLTVDARGRFKGIPVRARLRIVEFVKNERIISRSVAHLKSSAEWHFASENGQTTVRFVARYDWPLPILGRTLRGLLEAEIEALTESALRNLKRLVEDEVRPAAPSDLQSPAE